MREIEIPDLATFNAAFGDIGLKVGPRTGPNKRTQDDKEWYVSSNASFLLFDDDDEKEAFALLSNTINAGSDEWNRSANGCLIHVLADKFVCFDLLGNTRLVRRQ